MIGVVLLLVAMAAGAAAIRPLAQIPEQHAIAGLFGEPERERAIAARAARMLAGAEAYLRISGFAESLSRQAWNGVPCTIRRVSSQWAEWVFADGRAWIVRHDGRSPRLLRRMIISDAVATTAGLVVDAYSPGGGPPHSTLLVRDARDRVTVAS